jgi:dihydrofolate reductase
MDGRDYVVRDNPDERRYELLRDGKFNPGEDGERFKLDETLRTEALLLGRVTYGEFAAFWPSMSGPLAEKLNGMPTYVISSTLTQAEWNNATVRLFGDTSDRKTLRLVDSKTVGDRVAILIYRPASWKRRGWS